MGVDGLPVQLRENNVYYRASSLGGCTTMLVRARMGMEGIEADRDHPAFKDVFAGMEAGKALEDTVLDAVEKWYGWPEGWLDRGDIPVEMSMRVGNVDVVVGGHLDGRSQDGPNDNTEVIVEAKTCSDAEWRAWKTAYETTGSPWAYGLFAKYAWQFSVYWACEKPYRGILAVWNRDTEECEFVQIDSPPYNKADIFNRIVTIENLAVDMEVPDKCDTKSFPCPYFHFHTEDREEFDTVDDIIVQRLAEVYVTAMEEEKRIAKEKDAAYKALIDKIGDKGEYVTAEGWKITKFSLKGLDEEKVKKIAEEAGVEMDALRQEGVRVTPPAKTKRRGRKTDTPTEEEK